MKKNSGSKTFVSLPTCLSTQLSCKISQGPSVYRLVRILMCIDLFELTQLTKTSISEGSRTHTQLFKELESRLEFSTQLVQRSSLTSIQTQQLSAFQHKQSNKESDLYTEALALLSSVTPAHFCWLSTCGSAYLMGTKPDFSLISAGSGNAKEENVVFVLDLKTQKQGVSDRDSQGQVLKYAIKILEKQFVREFVYVGLFTQLEFCFFKVPRDRSKNILWQDIKDNGCEHLKWLLAQELGWKDNYLVLGTTKYKLIEVLGTGAVATVNKATTDDDPNEYAIKSFKTGCESWHSLETAALNALRNVQGVPRLRASHGLHIVISPVCNTWSKNRTIFFFAAQFATLLKILQRVHERKICHRDVSPYNIGMCGPSVYLLDWSHACPIDATQFPPYGALITAPDRHLQDNSPLELDLSDDFYSALRTYYLLRTDANNRPNSTDKSELLYYWQSVKNSNTQFCEAESKIDTNDIDALIANPPFFGLVDV
eukprot:c12864_g1_i1.p1 GENE.c12864_g1_i1~~c12864_g1_i1.p1  ORF type:complete len:484 (-),score=89.49 c12864_g1_i1:200-1651(-)